MAVVDQDNLPAVKIAPHTPDQVAVAVGDADDLHAVRPHDDGHRFVVAPVNADISGPDGQAIGLVVADETAAALAHDSYNFV